MVFYFFFCQLGQSANAAILFSLIVLVFVPIKYVYPSRLEHFSKSLGVRRLILFATLIWGAATFGLLWTYPEANYFLASISLGYCALYGALSIYRTLVPLG